MTWRRLWRLVLIILGVRRITPGLWGKRPTAEDGGPGYAEDTGGGWYRPTHRKQDPAADPQEPYGSEGSSRGNDHGWSNCTMASAAMVLDYHTQGAEKRWGGHMRHAQGDLDGGTDLYDARDAWARYGYSLSIRSGQGWSAVRAAREDGRAMIIQGIGNVPGSATFDGGHACAISPERRSDSSWLFGDPLAGGWQWVSESSIRAWAEDWSSGIAFAVSAPHLPDSGSGGEPEPPPVDTTPYDQADLNRARQDGYAQGSADQEHADRTAFTYALDALVGVWVDWSTAPAPHDSDSWDHGTWGSGARSILDRVDPCVEGDVAAWSRGGYPYPVGQAERALETIPAWDGATWREVLWT